MFELSRSAVTILGLEIHWYGILIALGVLGAVLIAGRRERGLGLEKDTALNLALLCVPLGILCARLYYAAFSWDDFAANPLELFNLRSGGLAIYGGVIGGALAALVYARIKRIPLGSVADLVAPGLAFGQALGRWGNFFNQEAYGAAVVKPALQFFPLSVYIDGSGWHYATFFYESIWCGLICAFVLLAERKGWFKKRGDGFLCYLFLYSAERCIVEGLRTDSLYLGPVRVSQLLSFCVLLALAILLCLRMQGKQLAWRRAGLCGFTLVFGISVFAGLTPAALVWGFTVLLAARHGYNSIPRTNDEM